jgi:hypothetical protein
MLQSQLKTSFHHTQYGAGPKHVPSPQVVSRRLLVHVAIVAEVPGSIPGSARFS